MAFSRRQFFRRLIGSNEPGAARTLADRIAQYEVVETYARHHLLPYDFSLTEEQEKELFVAIRAHLENVPDPELFSIGVRGGVEELVEAMVVPWREANRIQVQAERVREVRDSAADSVTEYLNIFAAPASLLQLRQRFIREDGDELEPVLKQRVREWMQSMDDEQLLQYDVFTVKDLVFAQLRTWSEGGS